MHGLGWARRSRPSQFAAPAWPAAFEHAGRVLADLNQQGNLTRGLRAVLTHHLLFAFNRLGMSAEHQHLLATAASQVAFQQEHASTTGSASSSARPGATTVRAVTTDANDTTTPDPEKLRTALADYICGRGTFRTPQVEAAFRTVPRHLFLPGVDLTTAYAPKQVVTKRADNGTAVSSASSPNLVAHGPDSTKLAAQVSDLLHRWDQKRPTQPIITAHPIDTPDNQLSSANHIVRPHTRLTITW